MRGVDGLLNGCVSFKLCGLRAVIAGLKVDLASGIARAISDSRAADYNSPGAKASKAVHQSRTDSQSYSN